MRQTGTRPGERVRFPNTPTHAKSFPHSSFHLEVGETEAGSLLCPVSWRKKMKRRENPVSQSYKVDCVSKRLHRCNCILSLASQTLKCNIYPQLGRSSLICVCVCFTSPHTHTLGRTLLFIVHSKQERLPAAHFRKNKQL